MRQWDQRKGLALPDRVAQIFYTHGVFCSAHPITVITLTVSLVLLSCVPLFNLPVPSNVPQLYTEGDNTSREVPRWFDSTPPIYIQQVIVKSAVSPWDQSLSAIDGIRAPLTQVFALLEAIENYQHPSGVTLRDVCCLVEMPKDYLGSLPQFSCLTVSPANLWHRDLPHFYSDPSIISTVYKYNDALVGKVSLAEVLLGVSLKESGIKRYPLRSRQRVVQFSVTLFLSQLDHDYLDGLRNRLDQLYKKEAAVPSLQESLEQRSRTLIHVYYAGDFDYHEFLPLLFTYIILFFYMYFSVRKIELVRSKVGMALSAVLTVIASLLMSVGLCIMFGLDPAASSRGREVFPYLVIVVGLENILVLTKSVVSTPAHLDTKIRLAQGLSKEGWSITKNLLTEVTILTCGLLTLVPSIQEFCMFAVVGLLCDFFLQMCFFTSVLSLDMRGQGGGEPVRPRDRLAPPPAPAPRPRHRHPASNQPKRIASNIPKRLRLVYFWARTRIVQRMFMVCMVVWIGGFLYSADLIQRLVTLHQPGRVDRVLSGSRVQGPVSSTFLGQASHLLSNNSTSNKQKDGVEWGSWSRGLAPPKWCYLVSEYNTSGGCRLAVVPPIRIKSIVPPAAAAQLTSPADPPPAPPWNPLADALDPIDFTLEREEDVDCWSEGGACSAPLLPSTPLELLLVTGLCTVSFIVIAYMALALYHCVCSRNYAQWRSSKGWLSDDTHHDTQVVMEAMPLVLEGHSQNVEWVTADGSVVASTCLAGEVNVWDSTTGELITHIDRKKCFLSQPRGRFSMDNDQMMSDYESGSPPPANESFLFNRRVERSVENEGGLVRRPSLDGKLGLADLSSLINTDFRGQRTQPARDHSRGFDYGPSVRLLYQQADHYDEEWLKGEEEDLGSLDSLEGDGCPHVWCMDTHDNVICLGTSKGSVEFWQASTGQLKYIFDDSCNVGVTCLKVIGCRLVLARLTGSMEVLALEWSFHHGQPAYRRAGGVLGHSRCVSAGRMDDFKAKGGFELKCLRVASVRAHQQPVTALTVEAGRILTASHDHTLKVFSLVDQLLVFTLHGHYGPVTHVFIDSHNPMTAGSASQDGIVCVWDLLTGACVFSVDAHDGAVTALSYSASYVLSLGVDDRLCVWDRFQGHLLNTIPVSYAFCMNMVMLSHNLLVTSKMGCLVIWDVRNGEVVRSVRLGDLDECEFIRNIVATREGVACNYGRQLRLVRFPLVTTGDKLD